MKDLFEGRTIASVEFQEIPSYGYLEWMKITFVDGTSVKITSHSTHEESELLIEQSPQALEENLS